ncbi:MAG: lipase family protein [Armatimonadota bacterium]|nr:lipase family protein [Armatimonadota bacterium]
MEALTRRRFLALAAAGTAAGLGGALDRLAAAAPAPAIDFTLAEFLVDACELTYTMYRRGGAFDPPPGYALVHQFRATAKTAPEWFGFVIRSGAQAVVAFRGSVTRPDWLADFDVALKPFPLVAGAGRAHEGFTLIYRSCRDDLRAVLRALPAGTRLVITGHSLGAALATICALDVAANTAFSAPVMYNFGSPRVGDQAFVDAYARRVPESWRIYNTADVVTAAPPQTLGYRHVPHGYALTAQTGRAFGQGDRPGNHSLVTYLHGLRMRR